MFSKPANNLASCRNPDQTCQQVKDQIDKPVNVGDIISKHHHHAHIDYQGWYQPYCHCEMSPSCHINLIPLWRQNTLLHILESASECINEQFQAHEKQDAMRYMIENAITHTFVQPPAQKNTDWHHG